MLVAGVDVSERRGQTVALLDGGSMSVRMCTVSVPDRQQEIAAVVDLLSGAEARAVAVDSPLRPSRMLLRDEATRRALGVPMRRGMNGPVYANYRVCDYELIRRGMPLYQVAASYEAAGGWMRVGFDLATALIAAGYRLPGDRGDRAATLIEVFPDASFVTLLGARPERKSGRAGAVGREQRRRILADAGITINGAPTHDVLDAVAAALTALRRREGSGCALGDADEGLIVVPVPCERLADRYRRA
jgi:predicted nuclease with RNAse H fold